MRSKRRKIQIAIHEIHGYDLGGYTHVYAVGRVPLTARHNFGLRDSHLLTWTAISSNKMRNAITISTNSLKRWLFQKLVVTNLD